MGIGAIRDTGAIQVIGLIPATGRARFPIAAGRYAATLVEVEFTPEQAFLAARESTAEAAFTELVVFTAADAGKFHT
jgi:hypothetical protein